MQTPPQKLSVCAQQVRDYAPDRFLHALFVKPEARELVFALYALEAEVAHVRKAVTEEMIAYIRFAWWMEALEGLYEGKTRSHPVLTCLLPIVREYDLPGEHMLGLVEDFRESFPDSPPQASARTDRLVQAVLERASPSSIRRWQKAGAIIARHRERFGARARGWLALKLLLA